MPRLSRSWIVAVVVAAIVALALLWRSCRSTDDGSGRSPEGFSTNGVALSSPDLDLELIEVRGTVHPGYTDWACILSCEERGGCRAATEVRIVYFSEGEKQTLTLRGRLDAEESERMRVGRMQRPPAVVDRIESVSVKVTAPLTPGAPRPTPVQ